MVDGKPLIWHTYGSYGPWFITPIVYTSSLYLPCLATLWPLWQRGQRSLDGRGPVSCRTTNVMSMVFPWYDDDIRCPVRRAAFEHLYHAIDKADWSWYEVSQGWWLVGGLTTICGNFTINHMGILVDVTDKLWLVDDLSPLFVGISPSMIWGY